MKKKLVIIGAGPVGCYTAQVLKHRGFNSVLIEEHREIGRPVHCTGLVGDKLFTEESLFPLPQESIINTINGAIVHYDGQSFTLKRESVAYVVDREGFDKKLSYGLNICYENKFIGLEKEGAGYIVETDKNELYADIVIGADGALSAVRKIINEDSNVKYYKGLQLRLECEVSNHDLVEVYLQRHDFFWVVPEGKKVIRVGVISENPHKDLQEFLIKLNIKGKVLEKFGGIVALGICNSTSKENVALVGGAACQVKPLSYGGVYFGMKAALILADAISRGKLEEYDSLWKDKFAWEIRMGLRLKGIYSRLNTQDLKKIFLALKEHKSFIEKKGDFENHGRLLLEIFKNPRFYSQVGDLLQIILKSIF